MIRKQLAAGMAVVFLCVWAALAADVNRALEFTRATLELGAGRARKDDPIDPAVGVVVKIKVGDAVKVGDVLFTIHANQGDQMARAADLLLQAPVIRDRKQQPLPAFYDTIYSK